METEELFKKYKRFIASMALYYHKCTRELGVEFDDLYQEGCIAFMERYHEYDEDSGYNFTTFIAPYLKQKMLLYIKKNTTITHIPVSKYTISRDFAKVVMQYVREYGREMTYEEKIQWLEKEKTRYYVFSETEKLLQEINQINLNHFSNKALSIEKLYEASSFQENPNGEIKRLESMEFMISDHKNMEEEIISRMDMEQFLASLSYLNDKEKTAFIEILGLRDNDPKKLMELAKPEKVTQQAISNRYHKALTKVKEKGKKFFI